MRTKCNSELEQIKQNCEYTAETHHNIATENKNLAFWLQLIPALITAFSALLVVGEVIPEWWGWLTFVSALVTAFASVRNPLKDYYEHLSAAKSFTALKHDARALKEVFSSGLNDSEYMQATKVIHDRYNDLIKIAPPTEDKAFFKAREKIQAGIHKPDKN